MPKTKDNVPSLDQLDGMLNNWLAEELDMVGRPDCVRKLSVKIQRLIVEQRTDAVAKGQPKQEVRRLEALYEHDARKTQKLYRTWLQEAQGVLQGLAHKLEGLED